MESAAAVEERLTPLEQRLATIEKRLAEQGSDQEEAKRPVKAGWQAMVGKFSNDPHYAEAKRPGRECRDAQRETVEDES